MAKTEIITLEARRVLEKLPAPEALEVISGLHVAADNNNNNFSRPMEEMSREEMIKSLEKVPTSAIRETLTKAGVIK